MTYLLKPFANVAFKLAYIVPWWEVTSHHIAFVEALVIRFWSCCNTDSNCFSSFPDNLKKKRFSDVLLKIVTSCHCRIKLKKCPAPAYHTNNCLENNKSRLLHGNLRTVAVFRSTFNVRGKFQLKNTVSLSQTERITYTRQRLEGHQQRSRIL